MRTNKERVVMISVLGEISHPTTRMPRLDGDGRAYYVPSVGGITYNFSLGDLAFKPYADHVEPDVSVKNKDKSENEALMALASIGNEATVISGDGKGLKGFVIGKHGGINHVLVHFPDKEKLSVGDKILIKAWGQGLKLTDYPDVAVYNIDPELFERIFREESGKILVPITTVVPGFMMGSGIGASNPTATDYDINTRDENLVAEYGIDKIRIGDIVAIDNHDCKYGVGGYKEGYISIGVVVHSNCILTGHGPGVVVILTGRKDRIKTFIDKSSNIKNYMGW
jgi:hypothetical protein